MRSLPLLFAVGCADPSVGPTRATPPVGAWTPPAPPPPPSGAPSGLLPVDPSIHWGLRMTGIGPLGWWGSVPGYDGAPSLSGAPGGFAIAFEQGMDACTAVVQRVDLAGDVVSGTIRAVAEEQACDPVVAVDPAGRTLVSSDPETRDAVGMHRIDPETGIERVFDVTTGLLGVGANRPALAVAADGGAVVTWLAPDGAGGATVFARAYDDLLTERTLPFPVSASSLAGSRPAVAPVGSGVWLAWSEVQSPVAAALRVAAWDPSVETVAWSVEAAAPKRAVAESPALAVGPDGAAVLAFATTVLGTPRAVEVAVLDPTGAVRVPATPLPGIGREPAAVYVGDDAAAVVWASVEGVGHRVRFLVLRLRDGAILVPSTILSDPDLDARAPTVAASPDGAGGVVVGVAWEELAEGERSRIAGRVVTFALPSPPRAP